MRKSKDITKYSVKWQLLRASIKGPSTDVSAKIFKALQYLKEENTIDAWERVYNFLEGLQRGYLSHHDFSSIALVECALGKIKNSKPLNKETAVEDKAQLSASPFTERYLLYKDLFQRSKKWLIKGYFHKEQEEFIDLLYHHFLEAGELHLIRDSFNYDKLLKLRKGSSLIKNKHKFLF